MEALNNTRWRPVASIALTALGNGSVAAKSPLSDHQIADSPTAISPSELVEITSPGRIARGVAGV
ncbi:MAG TPA: hypothetical protein VLO11_13660, partial [Luteolibacter sp.]|nr:hypothetical protein [Luteolibacter sp.]